MNVDIEGKTIEIDSEEYEIVTLSTDKNTPGHGNWVRWKDKQGQLTYSG